jgi:uncharacterized membrane protein
MSEIFLGVLLILAFPVIAVIALVKASGVSERLRQLQLRVDALEIGRPTSPTIVVAPAEPRPGPAAPRAAFEPPPVIVEPVAKPVMPPKAAAGAPPAAASTTLEERFGTQWVVWIGGLALALGGIFRCAIRSSKAGSDLACASSSPRYSLPC